MTLVLAGLLNLILVLFTIQLIKQFGSWGWVFPVLAALLGFLWGIVQRWAASRGYPSLDLPMPMSFFTGAAAVAVHQCVRLGTPPTAWVHRTLE